MEDLSSAHAGEDAVDAASLATDAVRDRLGVTGDHDDLDTQAVQSIDRLAGFSGRTSSVSLRPPITSRRAGRRRMIAPSFLPGLGLLDLASSGLFEQAGAGLTRISCPSTWALTPSAGGADVGARRDLDSVGLCL